MAALCCGYLLRFRTWQLPGSECSWCEVTQNKRIFSLEGWGLTVRKRGAKQRQMYWINTWRSGPEGWGFAPGWKPMSTLSVSLEMKQDYWRQALQSWRLWHFILCGFCGCPYISFCFASGAPLTSCYSKVCGRNTLTLSEALNWLAVSQAVTLRGGLGRNLVQHKCDFCLWVPRDHCLNTRTGESLTAFILIVGNFTCSQMMDFESGLIRNQSNDPWSVTTNSTENCCPKCWSHVSA